MKQIKVTWPGHDEIFLEYSIESKQVKSLRVVGCFETLNKLKQLVADNKENSILNWPIPEGVSHSDMLIRELLLKANDKWEYPYKEDELCHCRLVPTEIVDQAVLGGAHTSMQVTNCTGAASACSACQINIDKIIQYRINKRR